MISRLQVARDVARLRRDGFAIAWNVGLRTNNASRLDYGEQCSMAPGGILHLNDGMLVLGDEVRFGPYNYVAAAACTIRIGSRLLCSPFVSIIGASHMILDDGRWTWEHNSDKHGITIGDDCWLMTNSVILPGVTLGDRCSVAAGAIVTKSWPDGSLLAGVPARPLSRRA